VLRIQRALAVYFVPVSVLSQLKVVKVPVFDAAGNVEVSKTHRRNHNRSKQRQQT
jgi:hypothetical protein